MDKIDYLTKIYNDLTRYVVDNEREPERFELNQNTFNDLYDSAMENVSGFEVDKTKDRPVDKNATIFGVRIIINNRMKDGNWKFK